ncbi:hypothetical protein LTR95_006873, partial [Oleoguttula sp. CCFEE 5521]
LDNLQAILDTDPVPGRRYTCKMSNLTLIRNGEPYRPRPTDYNFWFNDESNDQDPWRLHTGALLKDLHKQNQLTDADRAGICATAAKIMERLPFDPMLLAVHGSGMTPAMSDAIRHLIIVHSIGLGHLDPSKIAGLTTTYDHKTQIVLQSFPVLYKNKDGTEKLKVHVLACSHATFDVEAPLPNEGPLEGLFGKLPGVVPHKTTGKAKKQAPPQSVIDKVLKIARYVGLMMWGSCGSKTTIKRLARELLLPFQKEKGRGHVSRKIYGTASKSGLFNVETAVNAQNDISLTFGYGPMQDVEGGVPPFIKIKGRSKIKTALVAQHIQQSYLSGSHVLQAWQDGLAKADELNANNAPIDELIRYMCVCHGAQSNTTLHVCVKCIGNGLCATMKRDDQGRLFCGSCFRKDESVVDAHVFAAMPSEHRLRYRVRQLLYADDTVPADKKKEVVELICRFLESKDYKDCKSPDVYSSGVSRSLYADSIVTGDPSDPLHGSLDGIWPVLLTGEDICAYHYPPNVGITAYYLNLLKSTWIPALVGLMRLSQDLRDRDNSDSEHMSLLDRIDHLYVVSRDEGGLPPSKTARMKSEPAKIRRLLKRWAGRFDTPSVTEARKRFQRFLEGPSTPSARARLAQTSEFKRWLEQNKPRIDKLIAQIEDEFKSSGHRLKRSTVDGAPWPFVGHHMPREWSWNHLYRFFCFRYMRMRDVCNVKWKTIDTPETLLLECVYQHMATKGRDEFLGLPITIWLQHPLCLSIGHRHHGFQMRTGFNTLTPTDLKKHYNASDSNILFETQCSNKAKWNFYEERYPAILDDLKLVDLKNDHYDVTPVTETTHYDVYKFGGAITLDASEEPWDDGEGSDEEVVDDEIYVPSDGDGTDDEDSDDEDDDE